MVGAINCTNAFWLNGDYILKDNGVFTNVHVGRYSALGFAGGGDNSTLGYFSGGQVSGFENVCIGSHSGEWMSIANGNTLAGSYSGLNINEASYNTIIGWKSGILLSANAASHNTLIGDAVASSLTDGLDNTFLGHNAGSSAIAGRENTLLGAGSDCSANASNQSAIGYQAIAVSDNVMILGNNDVSVDIGMSGAVPAAKLHVSRVPTTFVVTLPLGERIENSDIATGVAYTGFSGGLYVTTSGRNNFNFGVSSEAFNANINIGGSFSAPNSAKGNTGCNFYAANGTGTTTCYGVYSYAPTGNTTPNNFAIAGIAPKAPPINAAGYTGFNVGVYGEAPNNDTSYPFIALKGTWAGYFNGDLAYNGVLHNFSDSTLKININPLIKATALLKQMKAHTFYYDTVTYSGFMNFPKNMQYGLLAQEIEQITPNLVINTMLPPNLDSLGNMLTPPVAKKMLNEMGLIPILIEGFKEQQSTIDSLNQRLSDLEVVVKNCCSAHPNTGYRTNPNMPNTNVILKDNLTLILDQSQPNPFKDETDINYTLPQEIKSASIIFYDQTGSVLNKVELKDRGQGTIHIYAPDLSSGLYTYSLIVDGNLIETKTMVKTK